MNKKLKLRFMLLLHISVTSGQHSGISGHLVESLNNRYSLITIIKGAKWYGTVKNNMKEYERI